MTFVPISLSPLNLITCLTLLGIASSINMSKGLINFFFLLRKVSTTFLYGLTAYDYGLRVPSAVDILRSYLAYLGNLGDISL